MSQTPQSPFRAAALVVFICVVVEAAQKPVSSLISGPGSSDATIESRPYMVQIWRQLPTALEYHCSGTLIATDWVLTAAHCFVGWSSTDVAVIFAGVANTGSVPATLPSTAQNQIVAPADRIIHPNFQQADLTYDVAVLRTQYSFTLAAGVAVRMYAGTANAGLCGPGSSNRINGWGQHGTSASGPTQLQTALQTVVTCASRALSPPQVEALQLCADSTVTSPCNGDSGGPMIDVATMLQCGILAGVRGQGAGICPANASPPGTGVWTRVSAVSTWIANTTGVAPLTGATSSSRPTPPSGWTPGVLNTPTGQLSVTFPCGSGTCASNQVAADRGIRMCDARQIYVNTTCSLFNSFCGNCLSRNLLQAPSENQPQSGVASVVLTGSPTEVAAAVQAIGAAIRNGQISGVAASSPITATVSGINVDITTPVGNVPVPFGVYQPPAPQDSGSNKGLFGFLGLLGLIPITICFALLYWRIIRMDQPTGRKTDFAAFEPSHNCMIDPELLMCTADAGLAAPVPPTFMTSVVPHNHHNYDHLPPAPHCHPGHEDHD